MVAAIVFSAMLAIASRGQTNLMISSFHHNGTLTVTNAYTNAQCTVEWASSLAGPWHRSWQSVGAVETHTNNALTFAVPMFYRVFMTSNELSAGMVLVDTGSFQMGDNWLPGYDLARPVHTVHVDRIYMDRYEVTNERMRQVMQWAYDRGLIGATSGTVTNREGTPRQLLDLNEYAHLSFSNGTFYVDSGTHNLPCEEVTWFGAQAFCNFRSDMEGLTRCINFTNWSCAFEQTGYRLPTEAEWEKAARGGLVGHHYPWPSYGVGWTNYIDLSKANYQLFGGPPNVSPTPVGYYNGSQSPSGTDMANGFGLYDMAGNVVEWCWDWLSPDWYSDPDASQANPTGPTTGTYRVVRGGHYPGGESLLRCAWRDGLEPTDADQGLGFRTVRGFR